ncbi:MAG: choice-of-anchor M domain-containing protein [Planctomycetota bacterium]
MTSSSFYRASIGCIAIISYSLGHASATADITEYSAGHTDIRIAFRNDELQLLYHFGESAVLDGVEQVGFDSEGSADSAFVRVSPATQTDFAFPIDFLGTGANDPVWILPQSNSGTGGAAALGAPFFGIATHQLSGSQFESVFLNMTDFAGPGEFALFQSPTLPFLPPTVFWQTNDGIQTEDGDDSLDVGVIGHDHYNYGFTQEGIYDVKLTATADLVGGGSISSAEETFRFVVGNVTAIPEPGSFALVVLSVAAWCWRGRRRRPAIAA